MSRKSLLKSESAAAIVIAAVLLLGLAFTVISMVKLNYVPEWKTDAEREYSYDAWSSMEDVKTNAEIFTRFMDSNINYPEGLSATVPFNMGGGDIPVFEPSKSNSKLAVNTEECTMSITFGNNITLDPVQCGGITYYSENRQYPDQVFRYENGALILAQGENSQMKCSPLFNITEDMDNYTVTFNAINLTGETASVSSSTSTALRLTGRLIGPIVNTDPNADGVINSFNLSISTHYTDAWTNYFNNTAKGAGFIYGTDYTIEFIPEDHVCISFLPTGNKTYNIHVNQTVLCAELGRREGVLPGESGSATSGNVMKLNQWYCFETFTGTYDGITLSPAPEPTTLEDYNQAYSLPSGVKNHVLSSYSEINDFDYYVDNKKTLNLNFGFDDYDSFEPNVTTATIRMVYRFENNQEPEMQMTVAGTETDSFKPKNGNWCLYNETFTISPHSPTNLTLNLKVISGASNVKGNFHIDYLAVCLN